MTEAHLFAIGVLLAWLAGIRVYLTVFGIGLAGALGWLDLPQALHVTQSPWVIGVSGALALVEFFADKIPGVDTGWDLLHTLLRVPAGAFLAASAMSPDGHLAAGMLAANPGATILHNLICSRAVPEVVREHGGIPVRTKVGHSYIKQIMAESGAVFGGEHSAHYYFRDNYRADSGIIATMLVLEQLSQAGAALS